MKFSIGYNYDIKLLEVLDIYRENIEALYFPIPQRYLGSGRHAPESKNYLSEIPQLIEKCAKLKMKSQLLLNATCTGAMGLDKEFFSQIVAYVKKLKDLGLSSLIITNPVYISEFKRALPGLSIEASVNCYVKTVEQARYLKDLGVDTLTIDRDINRNIPLIKEIKRKTGLAIRVMLNEGCLRNCPFRNMHYNYIAHGAASPARPIENIFPDQFCIRIYQQNPAKVFSVPFIPPDALKYYAGFVDYFKLSTRAFATARIEACLKAYRDQDFNGNLLEMLDCPGLAYFNFIDYTVLKKNNFFKKIISCAGNCNRCNYCDKLIKEAVAINSDFLAESDAKLKEDKKAAMMGKRLLKASPDKIFIYLKLQKAYCNLRRYKQAAEAAEQALKLGCLEGRQRLFIGLCYKKAGEYKKAQPYLRAAEKIKPNSAQINLALFSCHRHLGQQAKANQELKRVLIKAKKLKAKASTGPVR